MSSKRLFGYFGRVNCRKILMSQTYGFSYVKNRFVKRSDMSAIKVVDAILATRISAIVTKMVKLDLTFLELCPLFDYKPLFLLLWKTNTLDTNFGQYLFNHMLVFIVVKDIIIKAQYSFFHYTTFIPL